ncbi:MAG: thymidylate synthase [Lachnospiraceae bacterium]|nr:thymidylate synthase [Lachnospiraceae bacterium]
MTKGDIYFREIVERILSEGSLDRNPRPHYADGVSAHTLSVNHVTCTYDLTKGESPFITLRPIAIKSAIGELLWIYRDMSNSLDLLRDKYGITWWDEWDIGDRTIGQCYGATVKRHNLTEKLLDDIKNDPDGRRHIINMWQEDDFNEKHGLKPCAYQTVWNVRYEENETGRNLPASGPLLPVLDMCLFQRSSDYLTAGCINQLQYMAFLIAVANHLGFVPGRFTWFVANVQVYDRHIEQAKEMLSRESIECSPVITLPEKKSFWDLEVDDFKVEGYPRDMIKEKNPQLKFDLGI